MWIGKTPIHFVSLCGLFGAAQPVKLPYVILHVSTFLVDLIDALELALSFHYCYGKRFATIHNATLDRGSRPYVACCVGRKIRQS